MYKAGSNALPEELVLFKQDDITVTPSWLELDSTSHAVRYIRRLTLQEAEPPRRPAMITFCIVFLLFLFECVQLYLGTPTVQLHTALIILCVCFMLYAGYIAFFKPASFWVDINFDDQSVVQVSFMRQLELHEFHTALARAMDWHRGDGPSTPQ